jgi:multiple sugar transport system substrate-binding protein
MRYSLIAARRSSTRRRGTTIVVALVTALGLAACGGGDAGEPDSSSPNESAAGSLSVYNWGSADEAKIYDDIFATFAEKNGGIDVVNSVVPVTLWGDYVSKLATQVASGQSPDLLNMAMEGTRLSVEQGLLEPLDSYLPGSEIEALLADVPQALVDAYTIDGNLYEIPNGWQTMVIYVNTDLFEAAGVPIPDEDWTWDEFLSTAQQLTDGDVKGFGLPWGFFQLQPWLYSNGASAVTDDFSAPNLTDPKVIEAVTFVRDLVQEHGVASDPTSVDVYTQFAAGKFGMIGAGRWPIPGWNEAGFTSYVALPWPKQESHTTVFGGAGWAISSQSENKELAFAAIADLIKEESVTALSDLGQQIPIYAGSANSSGNEAADAALAVLEQQVDNARPVPAPAFYDILESVTMRYMQEIVSGQIDVTEGLTRAQAEIEAAI